MQNLALLSGVLIALLFVNTVLAIGQLIVILKFERLLANASDGAKDHFEKLRSVRQMGV